MFYQKVCGTTPEYDSVNVLPASEVNQIVSGFRVRVEDAKAGQDESNS